MLVKSVYFREMMDAEPMTVSDLIKKLEKMPKRAKVYMVFDKFSNDAWDEDMERWRHAVPLVYASKEVNLIDDMFDPNARETIVLLEVENP